MISALFVDRKGPYPKLGCDCWDESRDATRYTGSNPIVAHPPCARWSKLASVHGKIGQDGGLFENALNNLIRVGGVLEHPASSKAFSAFGIPEPQGRFWLRCYSRMWVCQVHQSAYGHLADKATWLVYVGDREPFELDWSMPFVLFSIGGGGTSNRKQDMPKRLRHLTPIKFAQELIKLAEHSRR
jgi:hypothetical protein